MSERGRRLRDILGFTGVVLSLLFVGWEIRSNTRVARAQARVELTALNNEFLDRLGGDPDFAELWRTAWLPGTALTEAEAFRVELVMLQFLRLLENVYLQYQEDLIGEEALDSYGFFGFERFMAHPRFAEIWEPRRVSFDPTFADFLESMR